MGYQEWLSWLKEQDPDVVADILRLDSGELVEQFEDKAEEVWRKEYSVEGEL